MTPISAPGTCKLTCKQGGFTLLELLITLVIMSIAISLVTLSIVPDEHAQLHREAEQLALLLENAEQQARISGQQQAWSSTGTGYRFWLRNEYNDWIPNDLGGAYRERTLPAGFSIGRIRLEGHPISPDAMISFRSAMLPQPFDILISSQTLNLYVVGKSNGDIVVQSNPDHPNI